VNDDVEAGVKESVIAIPEFAKRKSNENHKNFQSRLASSRPKFET
jgi:hypothetical protein